MDGKKTMSLLAVAFCCQAGHSWAATPACSVADESGAAKPVARVERSTIDPATQARIVTRLEKDGTVTVDLASSRTRIRKVLDREGSRATFTSGGQRATIELSGEMVTITTAGRVWRASARQADALAEGVHHLRQSAAATAAKALLDRVALRPDTFEGHALLLTKALMGTMWDDAGPTIEHQRWARARIGQPRITRVATSDGPGDCWDRYAAEAIRIANDYLSCARDCGWSGRFCMAGCGFLYEVRAEAAFMWFISCSGGFFVG